MKKNEDLEQELLKTQNKKTSNAGDESQKVLKDIFSEFQKQKEAVVLFKNE
jgi:hypothetical protein